MEMAGIEDDELVLFTETVEKTDEYGLGDTVVRLRLTKPGDIEREVVGGPDGRIVSDDSDGFCKVVAVSCIL